MATIIKYPRAYAEVSLPPAVAAWEDVSTTVKASGAQIAAWKADMGGHRSTVMRDARSGRWHYRVEVRVKHRKLTSHQRFRPLIGWTPATSLSAAMRGAESLIAA